MIADDYDDDDRSCGRADYDADDEDCRECADYGELQCSIHGDDAIAAARAMSLDWDAVRADRVARAGHRSGVMLTADESHAIAQRLLEATPDQLAERAGIACLRCRLGRECDCDLPF